MIITAGDNAVAHNPVDHGWRLVDEPIQGKQPRGWRQFDGHFPQLVTMLTEMIVPAASQ